MRKPANMFECPPGGWHCRFPDGYEASSNHPSDFLRKCYEHLTITGGDTGTGWQDRMWDLLCETHPEIPCRDSETPERVLGPDDVRRFLTTIYEAWKTGAQAVSEEEQNARIDTCLKCPMRGHISCFGGCSGIANLLSEFTMGRAIRNLPEIHKVGCTGCGCYLESKTMFPLELLKDIDAKLGREPKYHSSCWMLKA